MLAWNRFPNNAAGSADPKQLQMMFPNGAPCDSAMHLAAYGDAANRCIFVGAMNGMPVRPPSPAAASATSPNTAAAGLLGVHYPGSYAVPRPAAGYYYPPYAAVKQHAFQQPQAAGVMPGQVPPPPPPCQATASSTTALALATQQRIAAASSPSCGPQSAFTSAPLHGKGRESPRSGRHRRGDGEATATPASTAQPSSPGRHDGGGIYSERRRHRDDPPPSGASYTRAPSQVATAPFGEVFPPSSSGPNSHIAPAAPAAAWGAAHDDNDGGDGGGRRRRRRRHGDGGGERRRTASPSSPPEPRADEDAKEPHRRRHRHRGEVRGQHANARSDTNAPKSASAHLAGGLADTSRHHRSNHRSGQRWGSPPKSTAANVSTSTGAAAPSVGPMPITTLVTPVLQPVTVASALMVAPPPSPAMVPAAPPAHRGVRSPPPISAAAPSPPPGVLPTSTSKGHRRHRSHRRTPSASLSSSGGSSDAASRQGSSSYPSSVSSHSESASRPASASSRDRRRRRRRDRRGRRDRRRSPREASPSSRSRPAAGDPVGSAPSPPTNKNASVAEAPKKKGEGGILSFFRRNKSAAAEADSATAGKAGAPGQEATVMMPLTMPQKALYDTSMRPCGAAVAPRDAVTGVQHREASSRTDAAGQRRCDRTPGRSQHPAPSSGTVNAHIPPQQGNGSHNPSADPSSAVAPSGKSKGLFGGLFRRKKDKADGGVTAAADASANNASTVGGWPSPPSCPSTSGTSGNLTAKAATTVRLGTSSTPPKSAPPRGGYGAAPMSLSTAPNPALMSKPDVLRRSTKKSRAAAAQVRQEPLQPNELRSQLQAQKQSQNQHSGGNRGCRRNESRDHRSPVGERGGRTSGNRDGNPRGRGRRRTPLQDSNSCSSDASSTSSSTKAAPKRHSGRGNSGSKSARAQANNEI
ncbi:hypothetical protein, unknown function [Leishmania infantum JPCM5]|uniref:Uncharacterized protein n=2 Tax=Leishmania infantum TaxID=5671 RepID=A4I873_LEIIN|nr:hypothetical protein, unknown function [Leishmania infantum JPCM5]CAC9526508.1 hypothetical_protein_-_conserved [Leishmania infantum]CAM71014.1 hypothetical protein, unknown function [Leishmania infantum JPCM5]SUZ44836.1 hypothetical_protein_-_conserved [Leishmania infantum]|eukprot:XP_001467942.1 hypothetical protein, unknown function [Leishmania infantum JPCM5]